MHTRARAMRDRENLLDRQIDRETDKHRYK